MAREDASDRLSDDCRARVLRRLGLSGCPSADFAGLRALYGAWCSRVSFDNLRKMIALRTSADCPLPGLDAEEFFETWLQDGCAGTCWPTSNALFALVRAVGFDARRVAGSMRDLGIVNHGSVIVRIGSRDWLIDTSFLCNVPLPLDDRVYIHDDPVFEVEVEPVEGRHLAWVLTPPSMEHMPCRLLVDPADAALWRERYEESRERSAFNKRLYARRNRPGECLVLAGSLRCSKTAAGVIAETLTAERLCACLRDDFGFSPALIDRWIDAGGLGDSLEPHAGAAAPPASDRRPPSRR